MQGWISLHRKIRCHPFYKERRKFSKFEAWIDLLLEANHADKDWIVGNEVIKINRGSFITSEVQLMERWQWSKSKVRAYLILLQSENMIIKKSDTKKTTIYIVNYDNYQDAKTAKEPEKNRKKTAKELQKDTTNNGNTVNNENKSNTAAKFTPPTIKEIDDYCKERENGIDAERFYNFYQSKGWMVGSNKMKDWQAAVKTWEKKDKDEKPKGPRNYTGASDTDLYGGV